MIRANQCDSCKEIYNGETLKKVEIVGDYHILLCRDCFIAFFTRYMERTK